MFCSHVGFRFYKEGLICAGNIRSSTLYFCSHTVYLLLTLHINTLYTKDLCTQLKGTVSWLTADISVGCIDVMRRKQTQKHPHTDAFFLL